MWEEFEGDVAEDDDHYNHLLDAISNRLGSSEIRPVFLSADEDSREDKYRDLVSKIRPGE